MSQPYDGRDMDPYSAALGSVKRARERAQAGLPPAPFPPGRQTPQGMDDMPQGDLRAPPRRPMGAPSGGQSRLPRVRAPAAFDGKDGNISQAISKPTQVPQWPLAGPPISPLNSQEGEPYRPPPGRPQQAPPRPQRPSRVPSILDQSRLQDPTPVFLTNQSIPENVRDSSQDYNSSVPPTPSSRMTTSSMGSIPDFPVPAQTPTTPGPPRKSANLGPPPSARRGVSSFYSTASFVSPIPEESPRSRSHASYASSAAMPESWQAASPAASPTYYDETDTERSRDSAYDDFTDESKLVRSASIGKRGKPALVDARSSLNPEAAQRPAPSPIHPFEGGPGYVEAATSSSNTLPKAKPAASPSPVPETEEGPNARLTPDAILGAYAAASATDVTEPRLATPSPRQFNRLSAIRRPPKLDIDAVREMEARGSMTSLPDLIRRATRLAGMIDRGKRPASRFEDLSDYLDEKSGARNGERALRDDRHQSGLSDMLAAFPPPGQPQGDRQSRGSWFRTTSWPLAPGRRDGAPSRSSGREADQANEGSGKRRRRCCGLPLWAFILVVFLLVCIVVAAVVIPLEFFVFKNLGNHSQPLSEMEQCQESLTCQNGGTNVISKGVCSCICTNGFTGSDCSAEGSEGCTTTNLVSSDGSTNIQNVTLGRAIPRLIADANSNFSIPLSGTSILAKLNTDDLSCIAQNSLVTFDGQATRTGEASAEARAQASANSDDEDEETLAVAALVNNAAFVSVSVITIDPDVDTTITLNLGTAPGSAVATQTSTSVTSEPTTATQTEATPSSTSEPTARSTKITTTRATPSDAFTVTEEVLDFARVSVLYILQEESSDSAEAAQTALQRFFTDADQDGVTKDQASNLAIGGNNTIDLVSLTVNIGSGAVGGGSSNSKRDLTPGALLRSTGRKALHIARHSGSVFSRHSW